MSAEDVLKPVIPANAVKNGAAITFTTETGEFAQHDVQVSGLHIPLNLQVISAKDNIRKANNFIFHNVKV